MTGTPHKLFICYSHTDQKYREQFSKFLGGGQSLSGMEIFSDAEINPGEKWEDEILDHLKAATAALVLVSQDFMVSPFIQHIELRQILEGHIRRGLRLFLVAVRPTNYQGTYLEPFQWARPPDRPLSALNPSDQEQAMVDVCRRIADELSNTHDAPSAEHTIACLKNIPKLDLPSMYVLHEPVGEGQFARCYRAHDQLLDRSVIIKVLNTELARDSPAYDKYVRSAAKLTHRNILGVLFSQANKLPHFLVTPALDGTPLDQRLSGGNGTPMSRQEAVTCAIRLADALAYAHREKCVHGRLRPCEVRFDRDDQPVLSGFRTLEGCDTTGADPVLSLEDFQYSSPERRAGGVIDAKGDQYLLGLLTYEMIAGAPPVRIPNWAALLDPGVAELLLHPPPLKELACGCDHKLSDVVMRMLETDPDKRWHSLDEVRERLKGALGSTSCVEEAKASYRRCAQTREFYDDIYNDLFTAMPDIRGMSTRRSMEEQYQVLADSMWLLLTFPNTGEDEEPTILSGIARAHAHFEPWQFDRFREAVVKAVARHDSTHPCAADAWKAAMSPGLEYLKARAGKAAHAGPEAIVNVNSCAAAARGAAARQRLGRAGVGPRLGARRARGARRYPRTPA